MSVAGTLPSHAQTSDSAANSYPSRPIRLIVPAGAGGVTDILARVIERDPDWSRLFAVLSAASLNAGPRERTRAYFQQITAMSARRRDMKGPAGSAFLFDTAGIHRQTAPVLKPRNVLFLNFHDPAVRIQSLDVEQVEEVFASVRPFAGIGQGRASTAAASDDAARTAVGRSWATSSAKLGPERTTTG